MDALILLGLEGVEVRRVLEGRQNHSPAAARPSPSSERWNEKAGPPRADVKSPKYALEVQEETGNDEW